MGLTNINSVADRLVDQMRALGSAVSFVSDVWTSGDLPWRNIIAIEHAFRAAAITAAQVQAEAAVNPTAVQAAISTRGGPATLQEFGAGVVALQDASAAWYDLVIAQVHALPPASIIHMESRDGIYRETVFIQNLPEATALTLQASDELADLRAELVSLGALAA